ncbi:MAG: dTDP-glucose 4,6-dehydratase [Vicinamibacterales bacterium]
MPPSSPPTWIVTGGAGFIGSNFVRRASQAGRARLVVFDKLTYAGHLESLEGVLDGADVTFTRGDIASRDDVRAVIAEARPSAIVNFAAESHVDRSIDGPGEFVRTNVWGVYELLEGVRAMLAAADEAGRQAFRFLHVSTDEVYGSLGPAGAFTEETPYAPNSPYSASKAAADHLVRAYHETYGVPTLLTNCSNNYGPFQYPEKLVPLMVLNALDARPLPIYGDGLNRRDWLHVEDHCDAILRVLAGGVPGGKYNVGGNAERTNLEMLDALCDALERTIPAASNPRMQAAGKARYHDLKTFVPDRPGHDRRYAIDASKIARELGFRPSRTFEQGVGETVAWYVANREWCQAVTRDTYAGQRLGLQGSPAR